MSSHMHWKWDETVQCYRAGAALTCYWLRSMDRAARPRYWVNLVLQTRCWWHLAVPGVPVLKGLLDTSSSNCSHSLRLLAGGHLIHCWTTLLGFGGSGTWRDRTLWVACWPGSSCVSPGSGPVRCTSLSRSKHFILAWKIQLYDSFWKKPSSWRAACCGRS